MNYNDCFLLLLSLLLLLLLIERERERDLLKIPLTSKYHQIPGKSRSLKDLPNVACDLDEFSG